MNKEVNKEEKVAWCELTNRDEVTQDRREHLDNIYIKNYFYVKPPVLHDNTFIKLVYKSRS